MRYIGRGIPPITVHSTIKEGSHVSDQAEKLSPKNAADHTLEAALLGVHNS